MPGFHEWSHIWLFMEVMSLQPSLEPVHITDMIGILPVPWSVRGWHCPCRNTRATFNTPSTQVSLFRGSSNKLVEENKLLAQEEPVQANKFIHSFSTIDAVCIWAQPWHFKKAFSCDWAPAPEKGPEAPLWPPATLQKVWGPLTSNKRPLLRFYLRRESVKENSSWQLHVDSKECWEIMPTAPERGSPPHLFIGRLAHIKQQLTLGQLTGRFHRATAVRNPVIDNNDSGVRH